MSSLSTKKRLKTFVFALLSALWLLTTANCKPTLPFSLAKSLSLPSFSSSFSTFQQYIERKQAEQMKSYSGRRVDANSLRQYNIDANDVLRMIYYNDQTIAIVELGPEKLLISCELIEIYNDGEGIKLLKKLSNINRPLKVGFKDMVKLMQQCEKVEKQHEMTKRKASSFAALYERNGDSNNEDNSDNENNQNDAQEDENTRGILSNNPLSVFSGVFPGTKWCGTGDIARDFHDLGTEKMMDRCCRAHDICPVKIRAYQSRYNLTNNSLYTKSHCVCDDLLFGCLKASNTSAAQLMGNIYFNLVQMPCLGENDEGKLEYRKAREGF
ncbi:unnamed protein product [Diamesa serratosioi]